MKDKTSMINLININDELDMGLFRKLFSGKNVEISKVLIREKYCIIDKDFYCDIYYIILKGKGELKTFDKSLRIKENNLIKVPSKSKYSIYNKGNCDLELILLKIPTNPHIFVGFKSSPPKLVYLEDLLIK